MCSSDLAKTDAAIVDRLAQETAAAINDPAMKARLADLSVAVAPSGSPAAFKAYVAAEAQKYETIIKAANVKIE